LRDDRKDERALSLGERCELKKGGSGMKAEAMLSRARHIALFGLMLLAGWSGWTAWREWHPEARFAFVNVGQGKCLLVIAPNGRTLMIDGGSHAYGEDYRGAEVAERTILPVLRRLGVHRLDAVLVTHPHDDHCNALPAVVQAFPPTLFWQPIVSSMETGYLALEAAIQQAKAKVVRVRQGQKLWLDVRHGVVAEVLGPPDGMPARSSPMDANDASAVVKVRFGAVSLLATGDAGEQAQRWLLHSGADLRATVLDVPHHGSRHVLAPFLRAVRPKVAVISSGRNNPFGHPAAETLAALQALNATIWRTDAQGGLLVWTDGRHWRLSSLR
jgi:competence protein ComEC